MLDVAGDVSGATTPTPNPAAEAAIAAAIAAKVEATDPVSAAMTLEVGEVFSAAIGAAMLAAGGALEPTEPS